MIYTALRKALFLGPVIRGDEHKCGRTSVTDCMSSKPSEGDQPNGSRCTARVTESPGSTWLSGQDCALVIGAALGLNDGRQKEAGLAKRPGGSWRIETRSMGDNKGKRHESQHHVVVCQGFLWPAKPAAAGVVNKAGPGYLLEASLSIAFVAARL